MKFFVFFVCFFLGASANKKDNPCPPLTPTANLSDPAALEAQAIATVSNLWATPSPPLSLLAQDLKTLMIQMANSGNGLWLATSSVASFWIWTNLPQFATANPSLCPFTAVVEGTLAWLCTGDCNALRQPLINIGSATGDGSKLVAGTALSNSECGRYRFKPGQNIIGGGGNGNGVWELTTSPALNAPCPNDGRVYDIEGYFNKTRSYYQTQPTYLNFEQVVTNLYNSPSLEDNLMAVITLASTSHPFQSLIGGFSNDLKFQLFQLQQSPVLPPYCCGKFRKALKDNLDQIGDEGTRSANAALAEIGC